MWGGAEVFEWEQVHFLHTYNYFSIIAVTFGVFPQSHFECQGALFAFCSSLASKSDCPSSPARLTR